MTLRAEPLPGGTGMTPGVSSLPGAGMKPGTRQAPTRDWDLTWGRYDTRGQDSDRVVTQDRDFTMTPRDHRDSFHRFSSWGQRSRSRSISPHRSYRVLQLESLSMRMNAQTASEEAAPPVFSSPRPCADRQLAPMADPLPIQSILAIFVTSDSENSKIAADATTEAEISLTSPAHSRTSRTDILSCSCVS